MCVPRGVIDAASSPSSVGRSALIPSTEMRGRADKSGYEKCKCTANEHTLCGIMAASPRPGDNLIKKTKEEGKREEGLFL